MPIDPQGTVGTDLGSPQQNAVPTPASSPAYRADPFDGAQVQRGTGRTTTENLGFQRRAYQFDPFDQTAGQREYTPYTRRTANVVQEEIAANTFAPSEEAEVPELTTQEVSDATTQRLANELGVEEYSSPLTEGTDAHLEQVAQEQGASRDRLVNVAEEIAAGNAPDSPLNRGQAAAGARYAGLAEQYATDELAAREDRGLFGDIANTGRELLDTGLDYVDAAAQPRQADVSFQDQPFTTSPGAAVSLALPGGFGALAAVGGEVARRNFERIYANEGEYNPETGRGLIPNGQIPGVNTPLAISEGAIPGTTVFSGNPDLIPPQYDLDGDGQYSQEEIRSAADPNGPGQTAYRQYDTNVQAAHQAAEEQTGFRGAQAVLDSQGNPVRSGSDNSIVYNIPPEQRQMFEQHQQRQAEQARQEEEARQAAQEAERQRQAAVQAEIERQQREAAEAAAVEAQRQREEEARQRAAEEDRRNREIQARIDAQRRQQQEDDDRNRNQHSLNRGQQAAANRYQAQADSGGGGGGGDSCFAAGSMFLMEGGYWTTIENIKVGDRMAEGGRVYGILQGDGTHEDWYKYGETYVTGSHFVYEDKWVEVAKSEGCELLWGGFETWYCVLNENHRMVAIDYMLFTDFDAVDSVNSELEERLNAVQE